MLECVERCRGSFRILPLLVGQIPRFFDPEDNLRASGPGQYLSPFCPSSKHLLVAVNTGLIAHCLAPRPPPPRTLPRVNALCRWRGLQIFSNEGSAVPVSIRRSQTMNCILSVQVQPTEPEPSFEKGFPTIKLRECRQVAACQRQMKYISGPVEMTCNQ
jgi:hypothetical protein